MTQLEDVNRPDPVRLAYHDANAVVASDIALRALAKTRIWALLLALALLVYAAIGIALGTIWLVTLITLGGQPGYSIWEFIILSSINLTLAPIAGVGGALLLRYHAAAGRACVQRNSEDLELAMIRLLYLWRWACVLLTAVVALPAIILFVAALKNLWP